MPADLTSERDRMVDSQIAGRGIAIGGRLVVPVGTELHDQRLIKVVRRSATEFEEEDLGAVAFVPLVGEHGWSETKTERTERQPGRRRTKPAARPQSSPELIREAAEPLPDLEDSAAFGALFDRFAQARVVLLGEATHGTSEFYRARTAITRRLIETHASPSWRSRPTGRTPRSSTATSGTDPPSRRPNRRSSVFQPPFGL